MNFGSDEDDDDISSHSDQPNPKSDNDFHPKEVIGKDQPASEVNGTLFEVIDLENVTLGQGKAVKENVDQNDSNLKAELQSNNSASSNSEFVPESFSRKESKTDHKAEAEDKDMKESEKMEESESPEMSVQDEKKKEEKNSMLNELSNIGSKPKRTPKPT